MRLPVLICAAAAMLAACKQPSEAASCSHEIAGPAGRIRFEYRTEIVFPFAEVRSVRWRPPVVEGSAFDPNDMMWGLQLVYEPKGDGATGGLKQVVWSTSNLDMAREGKAWAGVGVTDRISFPDGTALTNPVDDEDYAAEAAFNTRIREALARRPNTDRVTIERLDAAGQPIIRSVVDISRRREVDAYARIARRETERMIAEAGLASPSGPLCNSGSEWKG